MSTELHFITELEALALHTACAQLTVPSALDDQRTPDPGPLASALSRLIHRLGLDGASHRFPDIIGVNLSAPQSYDPHLVLQILGAIRLGNAIAMRYGSVDKCIALLQDAAR